MAMITCKECGKEISSEAETCPHCGVKRQPSSKIAGKVVSGLAGLLLLGYCAQNLNSNNSTTSSSLSAIADRTTDCGPANFTVSKLNARQERDYARLTGIVSHNCPTAAGVELKWTAYNSDGSVAFSDNFYPASTTNIPANTDYPFETMNRAPVGKWTYRVAPISIQKW